MKIGYMRLQALCRSRVLTQRFVSLRNRMIGFQVRLAVPCKMLTFTWRRWLSRSYTSPTCLRLRHSPSAAAVVIVVLINIITKNAKDVTGHIFSLTTRCDTPIKVVICGGVVDIVNLAKFHQHWFKGFGSLRGWYLPLSMLSTMAYGM